MKLALMISIVAILIIPQISLSEEQKQGGEAKPAVGQKSPRALDNIPREPRQIKANIPKEYEGLVKTFDEYWTARIKKDYDKAYALESEEFRKTTGLEAYKGSFGKDLVVKSVRALGVKKLNEKEVIVTGSMIYTAMAPSPNVDHYKPLNENWVLEGGAWKHVRVVKK